jgi:hypothetical protein
MINDYRLSNVSELINFYLPFVTGTLTLVIES